MTTTIVRTRFAPSPTGFLHIGGARTALFCWLYTKKTKGIFILRIEDTDRERSTDAAVHAILDAMQWLNLDYDEGPYFQTKRFDRYKEVAHELLEKGLAYRCYCSKERLEKLRENQLAQKQKPRYDGHCRHLNTVPNDATSSVIRFKNPETGEVEINDAVRGDVVFQNSELDDLIIERSDGTPTYNFSVVVDDWDMKVTHVIRGDDHLNNTPRQINILKALGATLPIYAHVPMILGKDGERLSKRNGSVSVQEYREMGILPDALLNYLVRLGWSFKDQEIFTRDEMIQKFDIRSINKSAAAFNPEKLLWLNQQYIKTLDPAVIIPELEWHLSELKKLPQYAAFNLDEGPSLVNLILAQRERAKTIREMAEKSLFFYTDHVIWDEDAKSKHLVAGLKQPLQTLIQALKSESHWTKENIHDKLKKVAERCGLKIGDLAQPVRVAVTGGTVSPPIDITLALLGQEKTISRLNKAVEGL